MKTFPAICLIELKDVATGLVTADAMLKAAPVSVLKSGSVHNGKFLILIGGSVASVEESYHKGLSAAADAIIDRVILPDVDPTVLAAILGKRQKCREAALGIFETVSVASLLQAADAAVKSMAVRIVEIRLADDLGGKGLVLYNGQLEDVDEALTLSKELQTDAANVIQAQLIPNLHMELARQLAQGSRFAGNDLNDLKGGEV